MHRGQASSCACPSATAPHHCTSSGRQGKCNASNSYKLSPNPAGGSLWHRWVSQIIPLHAGKKGVRREAEYEESTPSKNLVWKPAAKSRTLAVMKKFSPATTTADPTGHGSKCLSAVCGAGESRMLREVILPAQISQRKPNAVSPPPFSLADSQVCPAGRWSR